MVIDPSKYAKTMTLEAPVVGKCLYLPKTKTAVDSDDGWYSVELYGSQVKGLEPIFSPVVRKGDVSALQRGSQAFFLSWEHLRRSVGSSAISVAPLLSSESSEWEPVVLRFIHGSAFFVTIDYASMAAVLFADAVSGGSVRGMTPEMRHLLVLEQVRIAQEKADAERKEKATTDVGVAEEVKGRYEELGMEVEKVVVAQHRVVVTWKAPFYRGKFETVLFRDSLMVDEAGFCASGADKKFNITSLVKTAEEYAEEGLIWLTRT